MRAAPLIGEPLTALQHAADRRIDLEWVLVPDLVRSSTEYNDSPLVSPLGSGIGPYVP